MLAVLLATACGDAAAPGEVAGQDGPAVYLAPDVPRLELALRGARAGDAIELAAARYEGSFVVPAGVELRGVAGTILVAAGGAALRVEGAEGLSTIVAGLAIEAAGGAVTLRGPGAITLREVTVDVTAGYGIAAEGVDLLTLQHVAVRGPVTDEKLDGLGARLDAATTAIAGLILSRSALALEAVELSGFAGFGAILYDSTGRWDGGRISGCVGTGLLVEQSSVELSAVVIEDGKVGRQVGFALISTGAVVSRGSVLATSGVAIRRIPGIGLLQSGAASRHQDLQVEENDSAGIWVQDAVGADGGPALSLTGAGTRISANRGAGLYLRRVTGVEVDGATISGTKLRPQVTGANEAPVPMGDGIQLAEAAGPVTLRSTILDGNARVGLLVDGGSGAELVLSGLQIRGEATANGLVLQGGAPELAGASVEIAAELSANDGRLAETGVDLGLAAPLPFVPGAGPLAEKGLIGPSAIIDETGGVRGRGQVGPEGLDVEL